MDSEKIVDLKHAKDLDMLMMEFNGNESRTIKYFREKFGNGSTKFHECENNIRLLLGEGYLMRQKDGIVLSVEFHESRPFMLSDRGFAFLSNIKQGKGFESIKKKYDKNLKFQKMAWYATFVILAIALIRLIIDWLPRSYL